MCLNTPDGDDTQVGSSECSLVEYEKRCLDNARQSPLFSKGGIMGKFPLFARNEIKLGRLLGVGAFGIVREVERIDIEFTTTAASHENQEIPHDSGKTLQDQSTRSESLPSSCDAHQLHDEYLLAVQRQMSERCERNGDARYAVKYLMLADATSSERIQARVDLAIEVNFLHVLSHPHIVKMRGLFKSESPFHPDYFFLMDRLFGTLEDKTKEWIATKRASKSRHQGWPFHFCGIQDTNEGAHNLLVERLLVAHDIASVLAYMHTNEVIYRDLKPQNIGFDVRGHVKVFDFGLAKYLAPELQVSSSALLYNLTGQCGSVPYMAPEVVLKTPYSTKCDVFSFGILLYEILALKPAFPHAKKGCDFVNKVVKEGCVLT